MYMEKGDRLGYSNGILTLAIGAIVLLLIFWWANRKLDSALYHWVFIPLPYLKQGWWSTGNANIKKDFLSIRLPISWGNHLLWDCLDPLIIPFAWDLALLPIIGLLLWMFLSIRNHYDKVAAQLRLGGKIERQVMRAIPWLSLLGMSLQVSVGAMSCK